MYLLTMETNDNGSYTIRHEGKWCTYYFYTKEEAINKFCQEKGLPIDQIYVKEW